MGYDIKRFKNSEINGEFICSICHDVLQNPLTIQPCDHTFCCDCINKWIVEQENCPVDRNKITDQNLHKPFRLFMNLLNELEISCDFSENGCKQYTKLGDLVVHTDKCTFNPNLSVLCECGISIPTNELMQHQDDCVQHLKKQLSGAMDLVNSMNTKINQIESDLREAKKEINVFSEWDRIESSKIVETNMSKTMGKRLIQILNESLNERKFDVLELKERFCEEFGGIWNISYGLDLECTLPLSFSFIGIGKIYVLISMSIKPVNDVLIVDKFMKVLDLDIEKNVWSEDLMIMGRKLHSLSDDSLNLSERLLDKNIMKYFLQYHKLFPYNDRTLYNPMIGVIANISEFSQLRQQLMEKELITIILKLLHHTNNLNAYLSGQTLANILSEGKQFWEQHLKHDRVLNRIMILAQLKFSISKWQINSKEYMNFITFKPFNRFLQCNIKLPQEVHYFAVSTFAQCIRIDCKRNCNLMREDGCIPVLQELIKSCKTEEYVKKLANLVLAQNQHYLEYGNLDDFHNSDTFNPL